MNSVPFCLELDRGGYPVSKCVNPVISTGRQGMNAMNERINEKGRMDGWMDGRMDEWMGRRGRG
jgi:hypothetical protein